MRTAMPGHPGIAGVSQFNSAVPSLFPLPKGAVLLVYCDNKRYWSSLTLFNKNFF